MIEYAIIILFFFIFIIFGVGKILYFIITKYLFEINLYVYIVIYLFTFIIISSMVYHYKNLNRLNCDCLPHKIGWPFNIMMCKGCYMCKESDHDH